MIARLKRFGTVAIFLLATETSLYSQNSRFTVLKVMGSVFCLRLQKDLQHGDNIVTQDKLRFSDINSYLIVISPQDGRKMVKPTSKNADSELKSLLTDIVSLEKRHTSSRGAAEEGKQLKAMKQLKSQLEVDTLLILGSGKASFMNSDFALNDTAAMKVRFRSGNSYTEKPVSFGPMLDLSSNAVFGTLDRLKVQLIYIPNIKKDIFDSPPESVGSFVPRYLNDDKLLRQEIRTIQATFPNKSHEAMMTEIKRYIESEYGSVLDENLTQWLSESNLLKP